mgnify:CR=1 FL=1
MQKLLAQIMKFGVVGVIATVIDFGIMNLLHYGLGLNILIANTSGFIISLIFNYLASMKYVFAHKEGMSRRREFIIFVVLSVIGLVLNDGIVLALNAGLGLEANIAKICATALVMVYNFVTRKIFLEGDETKNSQPSALRCPRTMHAQHSIARGHRSFTGKFSTFAD